MLLILSFADKGTEDIYNGSNTKQSRKTLPDFLHDIAARKLDMIDSAKTLEDLRVPPSNRLEMLSGALSGKHSIRINIQWRIGFRWTSLGAEEVSIQDYH